MCQTYTDTEKDCVDMEKLLIIDYYYLLCDIYICCIIITILS